MSQLTDKKKELIELMRVEHKISSGDHDKIIHELGWTDQEYCDGFKRYVYVCM